METKSETIFLLGAGFTKAVFPQSPLNTELLDSLVEEGSSTLAKYKNKYETNDIEKLFQNEKELNNRLPDIDRSILGIKEKIADLRPFIGRRVNPALPFIETLKKQIKGIHGPVIDLIEFDDIYSSAVTAAAGGRMHYVVVDSIDVASKIIKELLNKS